MRGDSQPSRLTWPPSPGYFSMRRVKDGWEVPCRIVQHDDGLWQAIIDGEAREPNADPSLAEGVYDVWYGANFATEVDYLWRLDLKAWAPQGDPEHPCLHPYRPISSMRTKPLPLPRRTPL